MSSESPELFNKFYALCDLTTASTVPLAICVAIPTFFGSLAGSHVRIFREVYHKHAVKPLLMPPSFVFRPIWTLLYISMGIASYLVYNAGETKGVFTFDALAYYATQLLFNLCWPALFFRYRNYKVSLYIITATIILTAITTSKFLRIEPLAGYLMIPYLAWLTASGYLNKRIWKANSDNLKLIATKKSGYRKYLSPKVEKDNSVRCTECFDKIEKK